MSAVEFLDRLDVDIERIEKQPAVRRVRTARATRPVIKLRVQRVEPDAGAAEIGDDVEQLREIAEIAVPPVSPRPHPVKLHRQHPAFPAVALIGGLRLPRRRVDGSRGIAGGGQRLDDAGGGYPRPRPGAGPGYRDSSPRCPNAPRVRSNSCGFHVGSSPHRAKTSGRPIGSAGGTRGRRNRYRLGLFPRLTWCEVMQTAAASGHRRVGLSELPETAPSDPTGPRFLVEDIYPSVDGGRYPIKRIAGEPIEVWADLLREGPRSTGRRAAVAEGIRDRLAARADAPGRQRPLARPIHPARAGPLPVCGRNLDRPVRDMAQRTAAQARGGP